MSPGTLAVGDIVQLGPECRNPMFAYCLMVVTDLKPAWGAQGYVQSLGSDGAPGGAAYYRSTWAEMEPTGGVAQWVRS